MSTGRPLVVGYFSSRIGLGEGARLILNALEAVGLNPSYIDATPFIETLEKNIEIGKSREDDGIGPVIFHVNPKEINTVIDSLNVNLIDRFRVGIWAWEQPVLPRIFYSRAKYLDEVWASSTFLAELFDRELSDVNTHHICYPLKSKNIRVMNPETIRLDHKKVFRILSVFDPKSGIDRKNPFDALKAFQKAFPSDDDVALTFFVSGDLNSAVKMSLIEDPRVSLVTDPLSEFEMCNMFRSHDVFISLHRSEGFGLSIAKALSLGVPAIFTDAFGPRDFRDFPLSFPVQSIRRKSVNSVGDYNKKYGMWAEPSIDQAISHLRLIRSFSDETLSGLVQKNVRLVEELFGLENFESSLSDTGFASRLRTY